MSSLYTLFIFFSYFSFVSCLFCYQCTSLRGHNCATLEDIQAVRTETCKHERESCIIMVIGLTVWRGCGVIPPECEDFTKCTSCSTDKCNIDPVEIEATEFGHSSSYCNMTSFIQVLFSNIAIQIVKKRFIW
ncbi:hypothetical protein ILUMI_14586 [Ignelater luminosus]|uniref:DUF753 domain-containing protein n=1 Tax=Ignelater luminosus TaxID=2038154 RepID=A0A8K0CUI0_IGNLU|nr:hypothetical protein ILUMI_14586 [Ignelater luminosus]